MAAFVDYSTRHNYLKYNSRDVENLDTSQTIELAAKVAKYIMSSSANADNLQNILNRRNVNELNSFLIQVGWTPVKTPNSFKPIPWGTVIKALGNFVKFMFDPIVIGCDNLPNPIMGYNNQGIWTDIYKENSFAMGLRDICYGKGCAAYYCKK